MVFSNVSFAYAYVQGASMDMHEMENCEGEGCVEMSEECLEHCFASAVDAHGQEFAMIAPELQVVIDHQDSHLHLYTEYIPIQQKARTPTDLEKILLTIKKKE